MIEGQPVTIREIQEAVHKTAVEHGWWEGDTHNIGEKLLLMNSEISEAFEHYREGRALDEVFVHDNGKPDGVPIELADAIIRIFDFCGFFEIDIEAAILMKMQYNDSRPYRHGNKKA